MNVLKRIAICIILIGLGLLGVWFNGGNSDFDEITHAEQAIGVELDSQIVAVGDVKLHVVFAGPVGGEPVILIHGFPEFWYMWRHHIAALAEEGYRVAAPDMRGYNRSEKPPGRAAYSYTKYAADITGLMDSQGWGNANIIGHDIGARVSWELVFDNSSRVKRAAIFSVGHPLAFQATTSDSDVSWYRTFFNMPVLPELLSRSGGLKLTAQNMKKTSRKGTFSDEELEVYKSAWDREHAFASMLGAYRNGGEDITNMPEDGRPEMPVMFIYGLEDKFISNDIANKTKVYLGDENVKLYPELTHWLIEEEFAMMFADMLDLLKQPVQ